MYSSDYSQVSSPELQQPQKAHRRKRFTPEEDNLLRYLVDMNGTSNWALIAAHFPARNKRQVKERWTSYLSPTLKAAPFTPQEDALLEEKINELGTKWVTILKFFPNRTDVALKNRWNMIKRQRANGGKHQNRKKLTPQSSGPAPVVKVMNATEQPQQKVQVAVPEQIEEFSFFNDSIFMDDSTLWI